MTAARAAFLTACMTGRGDEHNSTASFCCRALGWAAFASSGAPDFRDYGQWITPSGADALREWEERQ